MQPKLDRQQVQDFLTNEFPQVADDFTVEDIGPMTTRVRMTPADRHLRPGGTVSGPTIFTLADCAIYLAIIAMIGPKALSVTTSASIDFMRKPEAGRDLIAEVRLLKLGRVLVVGDVMVFSDGSDKVVARASMTYSIPPER